MAHRFTKLLAGSVTLSLLAFYGLAFAADTSAPDTVENLQVFPGDGQVTLSWDPALDDTGVTGYNVYMGLASVENSDATQYTLGSTDAGDLTSYTMEGLSNDTTYYFAVKAYDEAGNESDEFSNEVDSTPALGSVGDFTEPTVTNAEARSSTLVEVEFSEEVVLPSNASDAFSVESTSGIALEVVDAYVSDEDPSIVFVVTEEQTEDEQYILTASSDIEDNGGNPVVSGTSDTALFFGSGLAVADQSPSIPDASADELDIEDIEAVDVDEITVTFTEDMDSVDAQDFVLSLSDDDTETVRILSAEISEDDASEVTILTEEMEPGEDYTLTYQDEVEFDFTSMVLDITDVIPPEEVTKLLSKIQDETSAMISWTGSVNSAGDLAKYLVYLSTDGKTFDKGSEVDKDTTEFLLKSLTPGETYTVKVTAMDESENESEGVTTTFTLPETGPALFGLMGLSLAGAGALRRRKSKDVDEF